jgi:hypothetical protein
MNELLLFLHTTNIIAIKWGETTQILTRPTLIFASDPINFYTEFG